MKVETEDENFTVLMNKIMHMQIFNKQYFLSMTIAKLF